MVNAVDSLKDLKLNQEDAQIGVSIVRNALIVPMKRIVENAGKDGSVIVETVRQKQADSGNHHIGYNVLTEEYGNMVDLGVIDPAKVTRGALENAASIAAMILTTEALITDIPEPDAPAPAMPQGGMY